jgi:hypothetical protein
VPLISLWQSVPVTLTCLDVPDISEESIHALMSAWGRLGGLSRSERKRAASATNLQNYRQHATTMPTHDASAAPLPVLFFPRNDNADAPQI